jgi:glycosyltransferase involved in cell wall biosynthesis
MIKFAFISSSNIADATSGDNIYSSQIFNGLTNVVDKDELILLSFNKQNIRIPLVKFILKAPILILGILLPYMWLSNITLHNLRLLVKESRNCDIFLIDHFRCAWIIPFISILLIFKSKKYVYFSHNIESDISRIAMMHEKSLYKIIFHKFEYYKLIFWEFFTYKFICKSTYITDFDLKRAKKNHDKNISITLTPYATFDPLEYTVDHKDRIYDILILGSFHWNIKQQNLFKFLDHLAKYIDEMPIRVLIAGSSPLNVRDIIYTNYSFATFLGDFSSLDEITHLSRLAVCIDEVGGGFKLKILDYLYMGMPIAGMRSALEGIPSSLGVNKFDNFSELIDFIYKIHHNNALLNAMSVSNATLYKGMFSKVTFTDKLHNLLLFLK